MNFRNVEPPDGWKYLQRETGLWIRAQLGEELVAAVVSHRLHKGLEPTDREAVWLEIQRQICAGASSGVCHAEKGEDYRPFRDLARSLSLMKIAAFSATLVEWLKQGMHFVAKAESERRAAICRSCPFNKTAPMCSCTPFYRMIDALIPKERNEPGLQICTLCGCSLRAKVLAPLEVATEGNPKELRLPAYCWQNS